MDVFRRVVNAQADGAMWLWEGKNKPSAYSKSGAICRRFACGLATLGQEGLAFCAVLFVPALRKAGRRWSRHRLVPAGMVLGRRCPCLRQLVAEQHQKV